MKKLANLLRKVHEDEAGVVNLETVLIIGAIELPVLIFLIKYGWPLVKTYFNTGIQNLQENSDQAQTSS